MAKTLTFPERVNRYNFEKLKELVLRGADVHPGANIVIKNPEADQTEEGGLEEEGHLLAYMNKNYRKKTAN